MAETTAQKVRGFVNEHAKHTEYEDDEDLFEAGALDSFGALEVIMLLQDGFKVTIGESEYFDPRFVTVAGIAEVIDELLSQ